MQKNKEIAVARSSDLALKKASRLIAIINKILPAPSISIIENDDCIDELLEWTDENADWLDALTDDNVWSKELMVSAEDDNWLDELIEWADENGIPEEDLPRDKKKILDLTELDLSDNQLPLLPESIGNLTNLTQLNLLSTAISFDPLADNKIDPPWFR
jgi:Leucine-rich repeat (LRR) protein